MLRIKSDEPPIPTDAPATPEQMPAVSELAGMPEMPKVDVGKVDPAIVVYKGPEMGPFQCGNCHFYDGEGVCSLVSGQIDEAGLCNLFTPMNVEQEEMPMPEEEPLEQGETEEPVDPSRESEA